MARHKPPSRGALPPVPWGELSAVSIDSELLIEALLGIAEDTGLPPRKRPDEIETIMLTYRAFYDIDPDEEIDPEELVEMMALAARVHALVDALVHAGLPADPSRLPVVAEAACAARLIEKDGRPAFQMLDFLAALARAEQVSV